MSPPHFVGYDDDPLPPEPFRVRFRPPKPKKPAAPARSAFPAGPAAPTPAPSATPVAEPAAMAREVRPAPQRNPLRPPVRPVRIDAVPAPVATEIPVQEPLVEVAGSARRLLQPRPAAPTPKAPAATSWRAKPAILAALPQRPRAATPADIAIPRRPFALAPQAEAPVRSGLARGLVLRILAGLALIGPLGWLLGWFGLPSNAPEFLMTGMGRAAWRTFGGPDAMVLYWLMLAPFALAATYMQRVRRPLTWVAAFWWAWQSLYLLSAFGLLPFRIPAPATPW